jgi:heat shock protein HslJ
MRSAAVLLLFVIAGCATTSAGPAAPPARVDREVETVTTAETVHEVVETGGDPAALYGRDWIFFELPGFDVPLPSPPPVAGFNITIEGGRVSGTTACNVLSASYDIDERAGRIRFTSLRHNRELCDRIAADTEEAVLWAMIATDAYRVDGDRLVLFSKGKVVARLKTLD